MGSKFNVAEYKYKHQHIKQVLVPLSVATLNEKDEKHNYVPLEKRPSSLFKMGVNHVG